MENEKIYSVSLGFGKEAELYGKWAKKNGQFSKLSNDVWHDGTKYWIPAQIPEDKSLQKQLIDALVLSENYKTFKLISSITILLPVARVGYFMTCLSQKYGVNDNVVSLFNSPAVKDYYVKDNFNWESVDEIKLQRYSSIVKSIDSPFVELQEEMHFRNDKNLDIINQVIDVFFIPVNILTFVFQGVECQWLSIADGTAKVSVTPLRIGKDDIFTTKDERKKSVFGCLSVICLFILGRALISFMLPMLNGWILFLCMVGVLLVCIFSFKIIKRGIDVLIDRSRMKKIQRIINKRKDFLANNGLKE